MNNLFTLLTRGKNLVIAISAFWILLIVFSYMMNVSSVDEIIYNVALSEARANFDKDVIYRKWASLEGGLYVPVSEYTPQNPFLKVANRDVTTKDGKELTLVNPAYMTRMVHELENKNNKLKAHLTSLNPLNPQNAANYWEVNALNQFAIKAQEYHRIETKNNVTSFNYMAPLVTEKSCLKCHAEQGYKVGDIRGGISVSINYEKFTNQFSKQKNILLLTHIIIATFGLFIIFVFGIFIGKLRKE